MAANRLSQTQENQLTQWVLIQDALGLPPTPTRRSSSSRNACWSSKETTDSTQVNGASTEVIRPWFKKFFPPEIQAIKPENRATVYSEKNASASPPQAPASLLSSFSRANRFNSSDVYKISWLEELFIPRTRPSDPTERRLLVLDGHGSHETVYSMYPCYQHKIHLIHLPPHTSHVLQPLDLSVFSPLKHYYRKQLGFLSLLTDSSPIGKQNFLICYQRAREQALSASNIKSGWKATATSEPSTAGEQQEGQEGCKKKPPSSQIAWSTPRRPKDLKVQVLQFNQLDDDVLTKKLLFKKITKGFDEKDGLLAKAQLQIQALETQLEAVRPKKRKKVETSPNSRFANIEAIRRAQSAVNKADNGEPDVNDSKVSEIDEDCIVVRAGVAVAGIYVHVLKKEVRFFEVIIEKLEQRMARKIIITMSSKGIVYLLRSSEEHANSCSPCDFATALQSALASWKVEKYWRRRDSISVDGVDDAIQEVGGANSFNLTNQGLNQLGETLSGREPSGQNKFIHSFIQMYNPTSHSDH
ncbi:DDE superfamily endonuclease [Hirsutella rhossiliensis]